MIQLINQGVVWKNGHLTKAEGRNGYEKTLTYGILKNHTVSADMQNLKIKFDALGSHDITYVGIIQTARASGMKKFPLPYVLTNCHNSLCAVGGTINEDDHLFGITAAKKYGGIYVPAHQAVIHQYMREMMAGCGKMLLCSDSHTRYGALGTMGVGEGGPELVKQLCEKTYDLSYPEVVGVELIGKPQKGVGPQDVALALVSAVFASGFVKNKVMEFIGEGIGNLTLEYRSGIDVMTTETTCLSSIWETDEETKKWFDTYRRPEAYKEMRVEEGAWYDAGIVIDLSKIEPMIALPFHPSNAYPIRYFREHARELLSKVEEEASHMTKNPPSLQDKVKDGQVYVEQALIAGCSGGTYENVTFAARLLKGHDIGNSAFSLSVYPASQPQFLALLDNQAASDLMRSGAIMRTAFCGPCFGAGDVPSNGGLSIRHATRNFPSREGARPADGQFAYVALMDARSIAATALNHGKLTAATEVDLPEISFPPYTYDSSAYDGRIYNGFGRADENQEIIFGPNITDWPEMIALPENLLLDVASAIYDPVTTTDELIPSGETSSYRSNPLKLSEFALSRKDPGYVARAKEAQKREYNRRAFVRGGKLEQDTASCLALTGEKAEDAAKTTGLGSLVFALKPGDGSAREQAASCQRVLGGCANITAEYATKRYRSNLVNWGMLPFTLDDAALSGFAVGDKVYIPSIRKALLNGETEIAAFRLHEGEKIPLTLRLPAITKDEIDIIAAGCLINYYGQ